MMVKRLFYLFVGVLVGTFLAFFAVLFLKDYIVPVGCVVILAILGGWFFWIARGGLKKTS
ncbi:MAG: hypothetical protein BMS9Abin02_2018 [Anaerolineae bacterium]|nr:MAG: hypothetical protein BMS9Abin02_2018 [Anaerolineae bacterium]